MKIHEWEDIGLGKAPYKFLRVESILDPNECNVSDPYAALTPGYNQGMCAVCGVGLIHNYLMESRDGRKFSVGCDCIEKSGADGLIEEAKLAKRKMAAEKREAKRQVEAAEKQRQWEIKLDEQRARNGGLTDFELREKREAEELAERVKPLLPIADALEDGKNGFRDGIAAELRNGCIPYGRGLSITIDILAKMAGRSGSKAYEAEYCKMEQFFDDYKKQDQAA